jgi:hypothetical protein
MRNITKAALMPMDNPNTLIAEKALLRQKFLTAVMK